MSDIWLECISNEDGFYPLTVGNIYQVAGTTEVDNFYCILDDENHKTTYSKDRFKEVPAPGTKILDSGERTHFPSGAVRDMKQGKGRCDLMPLGVVSMMLKGDPVILYLSIVQDSKSEKAKIEYLLQTLEEFKTKNQITTETMLLEVSKQYEGGAEKYGENNWQKGIPQWSYLDSATRHYLKYRRGDKDEPHDRAFVWNIMCLIWAIENAEE